MMDQACTTEDKEETLRTECLRFEADMGLTFPISPSNRSTSIDPPLRAIKMKTRLPQE